MWPGLEWCMAIGSPRHSQSQVNTPAFGCTSFIEYCLPKPGEQLILFTHIVLGAVGPSTFGYYLQKKIIIPLITLSSVIRITCLRCFIPWRKDVLHIGSRVILKSLSLDG